MSEIAQQIERARRKHAAAVLEYQHDPCATTFGAELAARRELERQIESARKASR